MEQTENGLRPYLRWLNSSVKSRCYFPSCSELFDQRSCTLPASQCDLFTTFFTCHISMHGHCMFCLSYMSSAALYRGFFSFFHAFSLDYLNGSITLTTSAFWELRTQKSKSHLVKKQSLNILPLKPGVGQYIAIHATLTARDFFLAHFYSSGPFTCIFSKPLPIFSLF